MQALDAQLLALASNYQRQRHLPPGQYASCTIKPIPLLAELLCHCEWYLREIDQLHTGIECLTTAKEICEDYYGDEADPLTGLIYSNMGVIYVAKLLPQESLAICEKALEIRRRCLPPQHPRIGESLNNRAGAYFDLGRLEDAQRTWEESRDIQEAAEIPNCNLLEGVYSNIGMNLMGMKKYKEADKSLQTAMSFHDNYTGGSFYPALTRFRLGRLRIRQERWEEAEQELQTAHDAWILTLGAKHRWVANTKDQLARVRHHRGHDHGEDGAIQLLRDAIKVFDKLESDPGHVIRSEFLLARILSDIGTRTMNESFLKESEALEAHARDRHSQKPTLAALPCETEEQRGLFVSEEWR